MSAHEFVEDGRHYNGGAEFFGYGYSATGEPRLKMIRHYYRRGPRRGQSDDRYFVDGAFVDGYTAALEALKTPPVFTPEELALLATIGDEPADHRGGGSTYVDLFSLANKGAIEWGPPGMCKRTDAGRAVLAAATPVPT